MARRSSVGVQRTLSAQPARRIPTWRWQVTLVSNCLNNFRGPPARRGRPARGPFNGAAEFGRVMHGANAAQLPGHQRSSAKSALMSMHRHDPRAAGAMPQQARPATRRGLITAAGDRTQFNTHRAHDGNREPNGAGISEQYGGFQVRILRTPRLQVALYERW